MSKTFRHPDDGGWGSYLNARMDLIITWLNEGLSEDSIYDGLSVDREQVRLLVMTAKEKMAGR